MSQGQSELAPQAVSEHWQEYASVLRIRHWKFLMFWGLNLFLVSILSLSVFQHLLTSDLRKFYSIRPRIGLDRCSCINNRQLRWFILVRRHRNQFAARSHNSWRDDLERQSNCSVSEEWAPAATINLAGSLLFYSPDSAYGRFCAEWVRWSIPHRTSGSGQLAGWLDFCKWTSGSSSQFSRPDESGLVVYRHFQPIRRFITVMPWSGAICRHSGTKSNLMQRFSLQATFNDLRCATLWATSIVTESEPSYWKMTNNWTFYI